MIKLKVFNNVRSSAQRIPSVEVNVDTVYVRSEIKRVEEMEFSGWEYNEIQYPKDKYIELLSEKNNELESILDIILGDDVNE